MFDAAASVYLDRFLNVPAARLPRPEPAPTRPSCSASCRACSTSSSRWTRPGRSRRRTSAAGGEPDRLIAALGAALVREDRNFHTIQCVEAAARQHELGTGDGLPLIAAARYLAAHATTSRSQRQTFEIARRLHRGERLYEEI